MTPDIVVVGSCVIDVTLFTKRIPRPGESYVASQAFTSVGGKASNQAIAAARLGARVHLVARVGGDVWGDEALRLWESEGVSADYVTRDADAPTGVGVVLVADDAENVVLSALGANASLEPQYVDRALPAIERAGVVSLHLNSPLETVRRALAAARECGARTLLNLSPVGPLPAEMFSLIDLLFMNEVEAAVLTGGGGVKDHASACAAGRVFLGRGAGAVVISRGKAGLSLITRDGEYRVPSFPVEEADTTGAGDALIAGLNVALAEGRDILDAARFGCAAAALSVTRKGTWAAMPRRAEVAELLSAGGAE
jgi:ribokinase